MATTDGNSSPPTTEAVRSLLDAAAGTWALDAPRSSVSFRSKTFWGLAAVRGTFSDVSGTGEIGPDGSAHGRLEIASASLDTKNRKRDQHLRSADFFNSEAQPKIVVTVRSARLRDGNDVTIDGELTVADVTRPLSFAAKVTEATPDAISLRAELPIDRADFNMTWNQLGMLRGASVITVVARFTRSPLAA
jgi:polyisoprenoid-binding protein YceI